MMRRTNLNRQRALTIRLDELFYDYDEFSDNLNQAIKVLNHDDKYKVEDIMDEDQYNFFMRLFGDFRTAYTDATQGRLEAVMILVSCYIKYIHASFLYEMSPDELNAQNNQSMTNYLGSYANVTPDSDTDSENLGIQNMSIANSKNINLLLAQTTWDETYQTMIKDWIAQIIEPIQPPTREAYRNGRY